MQGIVFVIHDSRDFVYVSRKEIEQLGQRGKTNNLSCCQLIWRKNLGAYSSNGKSNAVTNQLSVHYT